MVRGITQALSSVLLSAHDANRSRPARRSALSSKQREQVLRSRAGRCHICDGNVLGTKWQADHVLAHSAGGTHSIDNYLPTHALCNNYRWDYSAEEFQWLLKIEVWARRLDGKANRLRDRRG